MDSIVLETREWLVGQWDGINENINELVEKKLSDVCRWEYASGEYYSHTPYYNEVYAIPKGKLLKNVTEETKFSKHPINSFGFDSSGNMIISQRTKREIELRFGVTTWMYTINDDNSIFEYVVDWKPENFPSTSLDAIDIFKPISEFKWINVGIGDKYKYFTYQEYIYDDCKKLIKIIENLPLANPVRSAILDFIYDDNGRLDKIMHGNNLRWQNRKNR